jgi:membrane-associated phospholipid phosphatase
LTPDAEWLPVSMMFTGRLRFIGTISVIGLVAATAARTASAQIDEPAEPVATPHQQRSPPPPPKLPGGGEPRSISASKVAPDGIVGEEGGRRVAAVPDVTPIVPEPTERPVRAYQLYWELDVPLLAVAIVLGGGRMIRSSEVTAPPYCLTVSDPCKKDGLNPLDRAFAGRYSPAWSQASDIGALALAISPIPLLWIDEGFVNMLNDSVVIYQSGLLAVAFSGISSSGTGRGRPYVYGDTAPDDVKRSPEASLSYFSGHSTLAFALSTSLFWTINRRHPGSAYSWTVFTIGTATASFVATARVMAGKHFPSDVLAGAAVGAGVGTLLPALHSSPVIVSVTPDGDGALLTWIHAM